jgi:hypothetical protein
MPNADGFSNENFKNLCLERRLIEAHALLLDNADWDLPSYDHEKCCLFIANTRRFLMMHPAEIVSGGGSLGQGGNSEVYDLKVILELLKKAEADKDEFGRQQTAGIDFGTEQNWRA